MRRTRFSSIAISILQSPHHSDGDETKQNHGSNGSAIRGIRGAMTAMYKGGSVLALAKIYYRWELTAGARQSSVPQTTREDPLPSRGVSSAPSTICIHGRLDGAGPMHTLQITTIYL